MIRSGKAIRGPDRHPPRRGAPAFGHSTPIAPRDPNVFVATGTVSVGSFRVGKGFIVSTGAAVLSLPTPYKLLSYGTTLDPNSFYGTLNFSMLSYGGATSATAMPSPTLFAVGTGVALGRSDLTAPSFTLLASGTAGVVGHADLTLATRFKVRGFAGSVASLTVQDGFTINASGTIGGVAQAMLTMPVFDLVASGSLDGIGSALLAMPALLAVPSAVARLFGPSARMVAVGTAVVAATYEAYAVNLLNPTNPVPGEPAINQVTHYLGFPFTQIVRFNDSYFGVGADGVYVLGGETDNGAPIPWAVETAKTDFKSKQLKRVSSVYIGGQLANEVAVSIITGADPGTSVTYNYVAVRDAEAQTNRIKTGKGLRSRYYAFGFSDAAGNDVSVDTLDVEVNNLDRAI